jgi:hypothetical protein
LALTVGILGVGIINSIGNPIRNMGAYAPTPGKTILKCQKILNKNFACTFQHFKCARQVSPKTNIFCSLCKKDKEISHTMPFFKTKICLFYTRHIKYRFFVERLCKHIECRDIRVKFCVQIFWPFWNIFKSKFKN